MTTPQPLPPPPLDAIREALDRMSRLVDLALERAGGLLVNRDQPLANRVVLEDQVINRQWQALYRSCHQFLQLHRPSPDELRLVTMTMRTADQLERVGDYAVNLARHSLQLERPPTPPLLRQMELMATHARTLLHQACQAFGSGDAEMARSVMLMAEGVGERVEEAGAGLLSAQARGEFTTHDLLDYQAVFAMLEGVAERSANICRQTLFMAGGECAPERIWRILFLDHANDRLGKLAETLARLRYPQQGRYLSAGLRPAAALAPGLEGFLARRGEDAPLPPPRELKEVIPDLTGVDLVISLQGPVAGYGLRLPFRTAWLEWDLAAAGEEDWEQLWQELEERLAGLMAILVGPGGP